MDQKVAKVKLNRKISEDFKQIFFTWPFDIHPEPGQFFTINVSDSNKLVQLLRRPFAFAGYDSNKKQVAMIYQIRGAGTQILCEKKKGDSLDIIGPLGNYFQLDDSIETYIIIAGGIGLGPMLFVANWLIKEGKQVSFIFGCQTKDKVPKSEVFDLINPIICTEDGSLGFEGTTLDYINNRKISGLKSTKIIACGPFAMLKECHKFATKYAIECIVSMEQIIACGVGACMGCVIKMTNDPGYARVCKEGPVFNSRHILWT